MFRIALTLLLLALGSSVQAQYPGSSSAGRPATLPGGISFNTTPVFSPFLNLNRAGASQAVNYYGLVRPVQEFRSSVANLSTQLSDVEAVTGVGENGRQSSSTGQRSRFLNTGGYFQNLNGGTGSGASVTSQGIGLRTPGFGQQSGSQGGVIQGLPGGNLPNLPRR